MNAQDSELLRELEAKFGQFFPKDMAKPVDRLPQLTPEEMQQGGLCEERR
jgi:hypothetical protein